MRRPANILFLLMIFCLTVAAQSVDELVAKNIAARGGLKQFHALRTATIWAQLSGPGVDFTVQVYFKRPGKYRQEIIQGNHRTIEAYDGKVGWRIRGLEDKTTPEQLTGDDLGNVQDQVYAEGPLVDYKAKGLKVELLGKEQVQEPACYKLKVTYPSGTEMIQYLDSKSFLEIREELLRKVDGKPFEIEERVGNYQSVGGLLFAYAYDSNTKGSSDHFLLTVDKIEVNQPLDDALFKFPKTPVTQTKSATQKSTSKKL
jgi:hypothetical protein